jgi:RNA 2',3'-cyclic 3'-phosphodiesterase
VRLFVAVDVSPSTRAQLRSVREQLEAKFGGVRRPPRVTWVADAAAHVTVRFIGHVDTAVAENVRLSLAAPIALPPYDIEFSGVGVFPGPSRPRVVWIGVASGGDETASLAALVNRRLDQIIAPGESRPFRAHLTVARVKEPERFDWRDALRKINAGTTRSTIDHVTLYESKTSPKGPTYTPLGVTLLGGA